MLIKFYIFLLLMYLKNYIIIKVTIKNLLLATKCVIIENKVRISKKLLYRKDKYNVYFI